VAPLLGPGAALLGPQPRSTRGVVHAMPDGRLRIMRPRGKGREPRRAPAALAAVAAWLAVAGLVWGAVAVHPRAAGVAAKAESLSAATFPHPWPFRVPSGTLSCAGKDYQMWFVTPDGTSYAVSGTAMAASPLTPSALELAPGRTQYSWPEIKPVLTEGLRLCGAGRGFQQPG
jgi:hypothetical protein